MHNALATPRTCVSANVLTRYVPIAAPHCQVFVILVARIESKNLSSNHSRANPELLHLHQTLSLYPSHTHLLRIDIV